MARILELESSVWGSGKCKKKFTMSRHTASAFIYFIVFHKVDTNQPGASWSLNTADGCSSSLHSITEFCNNNMNNSDMNMEKGNCWQTICTVFEKRHREMATVFVSQTWDDCTVNPRIVIRSHYYLWIGTCSGMPAWGRAPQRSRWWHLREEVKWHLRIRLSATSQNRCNKCKTREEVLRSSNTQKLKIPRFKWTESIVLHFVTRLNIQRCLLF